MMIALPYHSSQPLLLLSSNVTTTTTTTTRMLLFSINISKKTTRSFLLLLLVFFLSLNGDGPTSEVNAQTTTDNDNNIVDFDNNIDEAVNIIDDENDIISDRIITTLLTQSQVVPPPPPPTSVVSNPNTTQASITFVYGPSSNTIIWALNINNPLSLQLLSANLHCGSSMTPSSNNIIVNLSPIGVLLGSNTEIGLVGIIVDEMLLENNQCVTTVNNLWTLMKTSTTTSGNTYVQITSQDNLDGEIRGNLPDTTNNIDLSSVSTAIGNLIEDTTTQNPPTIITSTAKGNIVFVYGGPPSDAILWSMEIQNPDKLGIFGGNNGASLHCASITPSNIIVDLIAGGGTENADDRTAIGHVDLINTNDIIDGQCVTTTINLWNFLKSQGSITYVTIDTIKNPNGELRGNVESPKSQLPPPPPTTMEPTTTIEPTMEPMPSISIEPTTMIDNVTDIPSLAPIVVVPTDAPTTSSSATCTGQRSVIIIIVFITVFCSRSRY